MRRPRRPFGVLCLYIYFADKAARICEQQHLYISGTRSLLCNPVGQDDETPCLKGCGKKIEERRSDVEKID
jgi:hypothetical protein